MVVDLVTYLTRFQWDMAKYPIKQSLRNIADIISKQVGQIETDLKSKSSAYNNLKGSLQSLEKKQVYVTGPIDTVVHSLKVCFNFQRKSGDSKLGRIS